MMKHVVVIRALKLWRDSAACALKLVEETIPILVSFVEASYHLHVLQKPYLGLHHPDFGTTCLDLAEGIRALLSRDMGKLFELKLEVRCSEE